MEKLLLFQPLESYQFGEDHSVSMIYDKYRNAWFAKDVETYLSCFHEDYEMYLHSSGRKYTLQNFDFDRIVRYMTDYQQLYPTCIYENEDILVEHFYTVAPDGSCEAILWSSQKKDGLIWRTQNGCTPITKEDWITHPINQPD